MSGSAVAVPRKVAAPAKRLPPPPQSTHYHRLRKAVHLLCVAIFVILPFFDLMRFDIPRARFYFAGQELWINEFGIIFLTLMFLLFVIVAASILYGRVYCGYLCPQMIFSEASISAEARIRKFVTKRFAGWPAPRRKLVARALCWRCSRSYPSSSHSCSWRTSSNHAICCAACWHSTW
jgi:polyferredoxin